MKPSWFAWTTYLLVLLPFLSWACSLWRTKAWQIKRGKR